MTQHSFKTIYRQRPIRVLAGWDHHLQSCYMVIEFRDAEPAEVLYSYLDDDVNGDYYEGLSLTFDKFLQILAGLRIRLPDVMVKGINDDISKNRGNYDKDWSDHS